ncbi:MAG: hypothetical protein PVF05_02305 [Gemmatimonadales bacterium]|jgi:hypothetical protein
MNHLHAMLLATVAQEALVAELQNFLARTARAIVRLTNGHETLLIVILIMLVLMYVYLRKT